MKKVFIFWTALYLLTGTICLRELVKMPQLMDHYSFHFQKKPLSVFKFMLQHYSGTTDENDADRNEDNNLPFKSVVVSEGTFLSFPASSPTGIRYFPSQLCIIPSLLPLEKVLVYVSKIFQPPRCLFC